jgi:hypothetical protein
MTEETIADGLEYEQIAEHTVESNISVEERAMVRTVDNSYVPSVNVKAKYPSGSHYESFPMVDNGLLCSKPSMDARLERVILVDNDHQYDVEVAAFSETDGGYRVVHKQLTAVDLNVSTYTKYARRRRESVDVVWDADWSETTDPLVDVIFKDDDNVSGERGVERPWDDE